MLRRVQITNFKSLLRVDLTLGRINLLIGENGSGKSNVLEALTFGAAALSGRQSYEFLASRGMRAVEPAWMRSAFAPADAPVTIGVWEGFEPEGPPVSLTVGADGAWEVRGGQLFRIHDAVKALQKLPAGTVNVTIAGANFTLTLEDEDRESTVPGVRIEDLLNALRGAREEFEGQSERWSKTGFSSFLTYSPEYSTLRIFQAESQILPLGVRGEGLFAHLQALHRANDPAFQKIADQMDLLDWFDGFAIPDDLAPGERRLRIKDRYLTEQQVFDQRSANEGFLYLLFYFTLVISPHTPKVFGVDNIDAALNPKLAAALLRRLHQLCVEHDKQIVATTHSPAILDALDLHDDDQRLFVVSRNDEGHTQLRRARAPQPLPGDPPVPLSQAFLKGYLGGLPRNF